jgi:hypothetical protein
MPLALAEERADALTRDEHLAWCKRRALEYIGAGDLGQAVVGMASDLKTHPDTDNPALNGLAMIGMMYVTDGDGAAVQARRLHIRSAALPGVDRTEDQRARTLACRVSGTTRAPSGS